LYTAISLSFILHLIGAKDSQALVSREKECLKMEIEKRQKFEEEPLIEP
jgi:hypothetical protein